MIILNEVIYKNHELNIINRNTLNLTGIKKVINLENDNCIIESVCGKLLIKGSNLEVILLDTDKGELKIKGKIDSLNYSESKKENKESLFSKLFK